MKIIYEYTPTETGYKLDVKCEGIPVIDEQTGQFDAVTYRQAFKAILKDIIDNHEIYLPISNIVKYTDKSKV